MSEVHLSGCVSTRDRVSPNRLRSALKRRETKCGKMSRQARPMALKTNVSNRYRLCPDNVEEQGAT